MGYASTVPQALAALVNLFQGAVTTSGNAALAPVKVQYGPEPDDAGATTGIFVGWTGWPADATQIDRVAADARPAMAGAATGGMGGARDQEQATIHCAAQVLNSDEDMAAAVTLAYAARDCCLGAVAAHRTLNPGAGYQAGIQGQAMAGATTLLLQRTANGALATVQFDVETDAFTTT